MNQNEVIYTSPYISAPGRDNIGLSCKSCSFLVLFWWSCYSNLFLHRPLNPISVSSILAEKFSYQIYPETLQKDLRKIGQTP